MTTEQFVNRQLADTRAGLKGAGYGNDNLGVGEFIMLAVTRNSGALTRSNWAVITADMLSRDGAHIERFDHWLCGWVEYLIVDAWLYGPAEEYIGGTPQASAAARAAEDWHLKLEEYTVADEEHFNQLESDELDSMLKDWYVRDADESYPMRGNEAMRSFVQRHLEENYGSGTDVLDKWVTEGMDLFGTEEVS